MTLPHHRRRGEAGGSGDDGGGRRDGDGRPGMVVRVRQVRRGAAAVSVLAAGEDQSEAINALPVELRDGSTIDFAEFLQRSYTDACIILHRGKIIFEHYPNQPDPLSPHMLWSVSKSFTGLIAALLVAEGTLDAQALVTDIIPELADSGWRGASVQQVLDMTADINYSEVYADGTSDVIHYGLSAGITQSPDWRGPTSLYGYLPSIGAARGTTTHQAAAGCAVADGCWRVD